MRIKYNFIDDDKSLFICVSNIIDIYLDEDNMLHMENDANGINIISDRTIDKGLWDEISAILLKNGYYYFSNDICNFIYNDIDTYFPDEFDDID